MANPTVTPIMTPATGPGNPLANPIYLVDLYGNPLTGSGGLNIAQVGGTPISPGLLPINISQVGGFNTHSVIDGDGTPLASIQTESFNVAYSGSAASWVYVRVAVVSKAFNAQALTATSGNTPTSIWTPTAGKKFRLMGYWFSLSAAAGLVFHDLAAVGGGGIIPLPSPLAAAAGIVQSPPIGNGYLSTAANNQLWIDATAAVTATGFVFGVEE